MREDHEFCPNGVYHEVPELVQVSSAGHPNDAVAALLHRVLYLNFRAVDGETYFLDMPHLAARRSVRSISKAVANSTRTER